MLRIGLLGVRIVSVFLFLASACGGGVEEENPLRVKSELVTFAEHPVAVSFAPDGRLFWAEQVKGNKGRYPGRL